MNNDSRLIYEAYKDQWNRDLEIAIVTMGNPENPVPGDIVVVEWKTLRPVYRRLRIWTDEDKEKFHDGLKFWVQKDSEISLWKNYVLHIMYVGSIKSYPYRRYR